MISAKELDFFKAQEQFQRMCEFLEEALAEGQRIDQVERGLFPQAMAMCLDLLRSFVLAHGDGDKEEWFPRAIGIPDLFHALKRLWEVAHCFHAEESPAAEQFVTHHLRMLLQGQLGYVLRNFRQLVKKHGPKGTRQKTVQSAITYYENNREHMHYDEYLAAGYPIASGVAEGACKHLVKDRMELAGMRWELEGAQAMLSLRAVYLNGLWDRFIAYRITKEQARLYGKDTQYAMAT